MVLMKMQIMVLQFLHDLYTYKTKEQTSFKGRSIKWIKSEYDVIHKYLLLSGHIPQMSLVKHAIWIFWRVARPL